MSLSESLNLWTSRIHEMAQSGHLQNSIKSVFGLSANQNELNALIDALSKGNSSYLPHIVAVDSEVLSNHPGAYAAATSTIYLNQNIVDHPSLVEEVLTHELGHFLASHFFKGLEKQTDAYDFTYAMLSRDNSLLLSSHDVNEAAQKGTIKLPGTNQPLDVVWFDTKLHNEWLKTTLPMINGDAYFRLYLAEKDSDAFDGAFYGSKYGLQTQSATHFDNNNIRGSLEIMRKRMDEGLSSFNSTFIPENNDPGRIFVNPNFIGNDAGVQNLLYRFGQIIHAFSDFYSHSNWVELAVNGGWMSDTTLLDSGLGNFSQLNPGDYIPNAPKVMVAMAGPDYNTAMKLAGVGSYSGRSQNVNWWVGQDRDNWGNAWANPKDGQKYSGGTVGGLMSGAVNGAIYYDADYSVHLRAINRGGWQEKEYFRGFSHGGIAGTVYGQWVSPLAKDSINNERENGKEWAPNVTLNAMWHNKAHALADLQLKNDFDRLGNLIFKEYGSSGLRKFADYALIEGQRDLYVSTFSKPGARWNWDQPNAAVKAAKAFMPDDTSNASLAASVSELPMRTVEVFHQDLSSTLISVGNRSYLTQVEIDGRWVDSAAGLVGTHYDATMPGLFSAAKTQHAASGGRIVSTEIGANNGSYLATTYSIENINTQARVYINNFDVGEDEIRIIDASGNLVELIDVDLGNYDQIHQTLLSKYNIQINARPETQTLTHAKIIHAAQVKGSVVLQASDFFGDADMVHAANSIGKGYAQPLFVNQDGMLPWLSLRKDGTLEISDITKVAAGTYEVYVSVADGASILNGIPILIAIDPKVMVGNQAYTPTASMDIHFRSAGSGAISIFAQAYDQNGHAVSQPHHLALRVGDNAGTPNGIDVSRIRSELADDTNHGNMRFFAYFHDKNEMVSLDLAEISAQTYALKFNGQIIADIVIGQDDAVETYVDEIYVSGTNDILLGVKLDNFITSSGFSTQSRPLLVNLETTISRESDLTGEFGLFLADLKTGCVIDPTSGVQSENIILNANNVGSYAVYSVIKNENGTMRDKDSFLVDPQLNLHNVALMPYYKLANGQFFLAGSYHTTDNVSHIVRVGENGFGVEDLIGGDYDFDDMLVGINKITISETTLA